MVPSHGIKGEVEWERGAGGGGGGKALLKAYTRRTP